MAHACSERGRESERERVERGVRMVTERVEMTLRLAQRGRDGCAQCAGQVFAIRSWRLD